MANEVITIKINSVISPKVKRSLGSLGRTIKSVDAMAKGLNDRIKAIGSSGIAKLAKTEEARAAKAKKAEEVLTQLKNKGADEEFARTTKQGSLEEKIASEARAREIKASDLKEKNSNADVARIKKEGNLAEAENNKRILASNKIRAAINKEKRTDKAGAAAAFVKEGAAARKAAIDTEKFNQIQRKGVFDDRKRAKSLQKTELALKKTGASMKTATNAAAGLTRTLRTLLVFYAINQIKELSDAYTNMANKLKLVTTNSKQALVVQERLFRIATEARTPIADVTTAFQRFDLALKSLGASQEESLRFTETLSKQLTISGLSTIEAAQGLRQLSQALNKGKLDGDEFRTVMETIPTVSIAIAKELGVTRDALLDLAPTGVITANVIRNAISTLAKETDERFSKLAPTIGQALTVLTNQFTKFLGEFNKSTGLFDAFSNSIIFVSKNIKTLLVGAATLWIGTTAPLMAKSIGLIIEKLGGMKVALGLLGRGLTVATVALVAGLTTAVISSDGYLEDLGVTAIQTSDILAGLGKEAKTSADGFNIFAVDAAQMSEALDIFSAKAKRGIANFRKFIAIQTGTFDFGAQNDANRARVLEAKNKESLLRVEERRFKITKDQSKILTRVSKDRREFNSATNNLNVLLKQGLVTLTQYNNELDKTNISKKLKEIKEFTSGSGKLVNLSGLDSVDAINSRAKELLVTLKEVHTQQSTPVNPDIANRIDLEKRIALINKLKSEREVLIKQNRTLNADKNTGFFTFGSTQENILIKSEALRKTIIGLEVDLKKVANTFSKKSASFAKSAKKIGTANAIALKAQRELTKEINKARDDAITKLKIKAMDDLIKKSSELSKESVTLFNAEDALEVLFIKRKIGIDGFTKSLEKLIIDEEKRLELLKSINSVQQTFADKIRLSTDLLKDGRITLKQFNDDLDKSPLFSSSNATKISILDSLGETSLANKLRDQAKINKFKDRQAAIETTIVELNNTMGKLSGEASANQQKRIDGLREENKLISRGITLVRDKPALDFQSKIEKREEENTPETTDTLNDARDIELEKLAEFMEKKNNIFGEGKAEEAAINKFWNKKIADAEKNKDIAAINAAKGLSTELGSLLAQFNADGEKQNKKAFLAQQSFALASALLSAAAGIAQAYDNPNAHEFTKFANAAAIAVATGIQIGNISKATFANGGPVSGRGTGTSDSIDAKLSNGEFVINSASTKANRMALEAINNSGGKTINPNPVVVQNSDQSNNLQGSFTNGLDTTSGTNSNVTVNVFPSAGVEATIETTEDENGKNIEIFVKRVDEVLAGNLKNNVGPLAASINQRINRKF